MEGICRGCLDRFDDRSELNTYSEKNRRLFVYSTGIQVKRNDAFTFQLCKACYSSMKISCNFKKSCRTSDRKLKNFLFLKESGDSIDFSAYLKINDDSTKIRFPVNYQNGTPTYKNKEDDNVSTSTSIRNFMKDILQGDELPDNEARIISEVIKEEADISDNSLDSHWLQDDVSVDTDFRLDFSFSPFSTPHSINNDHCYTSQQYNQKILEEKEDGDTKLKSNSTSASSLLQNNIESQDQEIKIVDKQNRCIIDKNLDNALKDVGTDNFSLDALLATPPMIPNAWAPSTPTINNILFGEKLEDVHKSGHQIENFEEVEGTINALDEFIVLKDSQTFFNQQNDETSEENNVENNHLTQVQLELSNLNQDSLDIYEGKDQTKINDESIQESEDIFKRPLSPIDNKCSLQDMYCKMCKSSFKSVRNLKIHMTRKHNIRIEEPKKKEIMVCDYCGKSFSSKKSVFIKHITLHLNPEQYRCAICTLTFTTEARLRMHQTTHTGIVSKKPVQKNYICATCGSACSTRSNYRVHVRRHTRQFHCTCAQCGAGFYRNGDLAVHMRIHTGEKPFKCKYCTKDFARHSTLNKHMKLHTGEQPFKCKFCSKRFTTSYNLNVHQTRSIECLQLQEKIAFSNVNIEN